MPILIGPEDDDVADAADGDAADPVAWDPAWSLGFLHDGNDTAPTSAKVAIAARRKAG
jgi:hypothetical protein